MISFKCFLIFSLLYLVDSTRIINFNFFKKYISVFKPNPQLCMQIFSSFYFISNVYAAENPDKSLFGLKNDRLQICAAQSNCISTSNVKSLDKYSAPWIIPSQINDPEVGWLNLIAVIKNDKSLIVKEINSNEHYLRAEAKSSYPPTGTDDVEFLMPYPSDRTIFYRSNSRDVISAGPQIVLSDSSTHRSRLEKIRTKSNLEILGDVNDEEEKYLKDFEKLNFFQKMNILSQPADINFLDNEVPDPE